MVATLCYWKCRGLAQPIKFLLEYAEAPYTDKVLQPGSKDVWLQEKPNLGLDFPNLPYYIDGDVKLTQSGAIIRYLSRKYKLDGRTELEKQRLEMLEYELTDHRTAFGKLIFGSTDLEKDKKTHIEETMPKVFKRYSTFLGGGKWFAGENITYGDFIVYEYFTAQSRFDPGCLDKYENLSHFVKRFESLDAIAKYMKSDRYIDWPFTAATMAKWGHHK